MHRSCSAKNSSPARQEDDLIDHFLRRPCSPQLRQSMYQIADGAFLRMPVSDTGVVHSAGGNGKQVGIMCDQNATLTSGKLELRLIRRTNQPCILGSRDIDSTACKTSANATVDILIQMIPDLHQTQSLMTARPPRRLALAGDPRSVCRHRGAACSIALRCCQ